MDRLRKFWAVAAVTAGSLGITLSLMLGGAFGSAAATGASPAVTPTSTTGADASTIFGCRASVSRVSLAGSVLAEPAIANAGTNPCEDDNTLVQQTGLAGSTSPLNLGSVGPAGAYTDEVGADGGATAPAATSVTDVQAINLTFGGYTLTAVGPLESVAAVECTGTAVTTQGSTSGLSALTVTGPGLPTGGEKLDLGGPTNELGGALAPLAAILTIKANEQIVTATSTTERLLDITLLASNVQVIVGEAQVSYANGSNSCLGNVPPTQVTTVTTPGVTQTVTSANGTATTITSPAVTHTVTGASGLPTTVTTGASTTVVEPSGSVPGYLQQCATGSVLDPTTGDCVIYYGGQTIFVSKPFKGPIGGTVVPLGVAKSEYRSPCLSGAGPDYVLVVTKSHEKAFGTPMSDRILVLGSYDHTEGLAGNDCIDGLGTTEKINDGNGKDRLYVTKGVNRVIGGNGPNLIYGGNGKDWITDGTGDDTIHSSKLGSRIDAFGNKKHIFGGAGKDRIWTNSVVAQIHCGSDKKTLVFARRNPAAYAAKHGCKRIVLLH